MVLHVFRAFFKLIHFDLLVSRRNFEKLYNDVRGCPIRGRGFSQDTVAGICRAVDLACICYWKEVRCLQRSAATTCLLRASSVPAEMVVGTQHTPFKSHAWVELDGAVVNDKPYTSELYSVLIRC